MQRGICRGRLCLLPLVVLVTSCASYTVPTGDAVADVYVETSPNAWEADPSIPPAILAFQAGQDGHLRQVETFNTSESVMIAQGNTVFTYDPPLAIHQYTIAKDGSLTGPVSSLNPAKYDSTACGAPTGRGLLDPTGTYLTVELENYDQGCDVWQTYRIQNDGTYQILGQDSSHQWIWFKGGALMGDPGPGAMSKDGQFAYALGDIEGWTFLVGMKRDASGVMRIWDGFTWPYDTQYEWQPGGPLTDASNHMLLPMQGETNANWNHTGLASFTIDPGTGNLQAISTYDDMPKRASEAWGIAFTPQGDMIAVGAVDGSIQTYLFRNDGPATPAAIAGQVPQGQFIQSMLWDTTHHLYVLTQTLHKQPAIAQFSLYVFTVADGQLKPAPGSPWKVPNAYGLTVVPRG